MSAAISSIPPACAPIDEAGLCAWLAQAKAGDALEYHRGFLVIDRAAIGLHRDIAARRELIRTSDRAMRLAADGLVHLVQRRLGAERFSYLAIARPRADRRSLSFSTLFAEEAA
jgi:hypothetical protein